VKRLRPDKRVIAAFPPGRHSVDVKRAVDGHISVGQDKIRNSQLPSTVTTGSGIVLQRPKYWS
jgi:hypothetical protein